MERAVKIEGCWSRIEGRFARFGQESYGEGVSQLEHALQSAHLARRAGADDAEVIAALLHDLGHLIPEAPRMGDLGVDHHEEVGARLLASEGFGSAVTDPVAAHVAAKRYLVFRDARYRARLSDASRASLRHQGEAMTIDEARAFEQSPGFAAALRLRSFDDRAKVPGLAVPGLETYRALVLDHLRAQGRAGGLE